MEWVRGGYLIRYRWQLMFQVFQAFVNIHPEPLCDKKAPTTYKQKNLEVVGNAESLVREAQKRALGHNICSKLKVLVH